MDRTTETIQAGPVVQAWSDMGLQTFQLVDELTFTISQTGLGLYEIPDADLMHVYPGDLLAVKETTARIELLTTPDAATEFTYNVNVDANWAGRSTNGYILTGTPSTLSAKHAFKAYLTKSVKLRFQHEFNSLTGGYYDATITVGNNVTVPAVTTTAVIEVQVVIDNVTIEVVTAGKNNILC